MLVLFDIDATMIHTSRAGLIAMETAGRELFGPSFSTDGIEFAGRLDPLIVSDMFRALGKRPTPSELSAFRARYGQHLERRLQSREGCRALPGVQELLRSLSGVDGLVLGVLTGNWAETGSMKLRACGIDPEVFAVRVWGDDSPHDPPSREHLPVVAMEQYRVKLGRGVDAASVTIIGDTPHDVSCALVNGCRVLGVGTGQFGVAELERAGAHLALGDLSDVPRVQRWLISGRL